MFIYYVMISHWFVTYLFCYFLGKNYSNVNWRAFYAVVAGSSLFLLMGLRHYSVGSDIVQYLRVYNMILPTIPGNLLAYEEWGYRLLIILFKKLEISNQGYILLTSFIISFSFTTLYYKYSNNIFISLYLHLTIGMFTMSMSGVRQTLAVCLILLAFHFIRKQKLIAFLLAVGVAWTIHNSAAVFFPMYLFRNVRIDKVRGTTLVLISGLTLIFRRYLSPIVAIFMPDRYSSRYELISDEYPINPLLIVIAFAIPVVCLLFWKEVEVMSNENKSLFSLLFILSCANIIANVLSLNSNLIGRLSFYFMPFNTILIPNIISIIKDQKLKIIGLYFCMLLPLIQFMLGVPGGTLNIDQYKFFWQ